MQLSGKLADSSLKKEGHPEYAAGHHRVPRTWYLVLDSKVARFFKKTGTNLELVGESTPSDELADAGYMSNDEIGRSGRSGPGKSRHKMEPLMSPARKQNLYFVHEIAEWLENAVQNDIFDRLVIAAAPQILGDLRHVMPKAVQQKVQVEIDKNLTKMDEKSLAEELELLDLL